MYLKNSCQAWVRMLCFCSSQLHSGCCTVRSSSTIWLLSCYMRRAPERTVVELGNYVGNVLVWRCNRSGPSVIFNLQNKCDQPFESFWQLNSCLSNFFSQNSLKMKMDSTKSFTVQNFKERVFSKFVETCKYSCGEAMLQFSMKSRNGGRTMLTPKLK